MMYNLDFVPSVLKVIAKYKKSNPSLYKKLIVSYRIFRNIPGLVKDTPNHWLEEII